MADEDDRVMLSTQPHGNLLEFLANIDKLRTRFEGRFKMRKETTKDKDGNKNAKAEEGKSTGEVKNAENQQRDRIFLKVMRPWITDQQRFGKPQRYQEDWFRLNNWIEERRSWQNSPRAEEAQRRDCEPIRQLGGYRNVENKNDGYCASGPRDKRWNPDPRPQWHQRNNPNQPRAQSWEQRRPPWRGQNFQQRAEGYANPRYERPNQGSRPGPSYWAKEAEGTTPREEHHQMRGPYRGPNHSRALN